MKAIATILSTAAVLAAVVAAAGYTLDITVVLAIGFAAGLVALFVRDYRRTPRYNLEAPNAPARANRRLRHAGAGVEFATLATFNTMVG